MPADQAHLRLCRAFAVVCETSPAPLRRTDSTFRGNIGAEARRPCAKRQRKLAVIAAAIPAAGRTTREGKFCHGRPATGKPNSASDPKTPIVSSRIAEIVALQSARSPA